MTASTFHVIKAIRSKVWREDGDYFMIITGPKGKGKSTSAMAWGLAINPRMPLDASWVVFNARDFRQKLRELKRGDVLIWDDAGVGLASREAMTRLNREISKCVQTCRDKHLIVIFTTLGFGYIDKQVRKLFDAYVEAVALDRTKEVCVWKYFNLELNARSDDMYFKYPIYYDGTKRIRVTRMKIRKPPEELIKAYKKKRREFAEKVRDGTFKKDSADEGEGRDRSGYTHKCTWQYRSRTNDFRCKRCGKLTKDRPKDLI